MIQGLDEYQDLAARTGRMNMSDGQKIAMGAMGLCGEAGEVSDYLKKVIFHELPLDREKIKKELGDTLWYLAVLAHYLEIPLSEVADTNIEKLRLRYPRGFNPEDAAKRADGEMIDQDHD